MWHEKIGDFIFRPYRPALHQVEFLTVIKVKIPSEKEADLTN